MVLGLSLKGTQSCFQLKFRSFILELLCLFPWQCLCWSNILLTSIYAYGFRIRVTEALLIQENILRILVKVWDLIHFQIVMLNEEAILELLHLLIEESTENSVLWETTELTKIQVENQSLLCCTVQHQQRSKAVELLLKKGMPFQVLSQIFNATPYLFVLTLLPLLSAWLTQKCFVLVCQRLINNQDSLLRQIWSDLIMTY